VEGVVCALDVGTVPVFAAAEDGTVPLDNPRINGPTALKPRCLMRTHWIVPIGLAVCLTATLAMAQPPGWGERGGRGERSFGPPGGSDHGHGDRSVGPPGRGDQPPQQMSAEEAEQRARRADFFLSELDANRNGVIEAEEVSGGKKFYADRLLQRAGIEPTYPLSLAKVREGIQRYYQSQTTPGGAGMTPGAPAGYYGGPPGSGPSPNNDPNGERRRLFEQMFAEFKHLDANNNGIIEPDEATGGTSHSHKDIFEKTMAKAGLPPTLPARVETVRERLMAVIVSGASASSTYGGTASVPGFGAVASPQAPVAGFGPIADTQPVSTSRPSAGGSPASTLPPPRNDEEARVQKYASSLLAQYDKNKNGVLEPDEWKEMKGDVKSADKNGDGNVTLEELTAWLQQFSRGGGGGGGHGRDDAPKSGGDPSAPGASGSSAKKVSLRFSTPIERLPAGLPDWFLQKDVNADGQVSMAEYASDWSKTKVDEFYEFDLNRDGYITPAEVLSVEKAKAKAAKEGKSSKDSGRELAKGPPAPPAPAWGRGPGFGPPPPGPPSKESRQESGKEPSKEVAKESNKEPSKESGKPPSKEPSKEPGKDPRDRRPGWGRR
jgi:hypothetical protein